MKFRDQTSHEDLDNSKPDPSHPSPAGFDSQLLTAIIETRMPFGKYSGRPLLDLPSPYLAWFARRGFPTGKLGMMLQTVYEIKLNGLERLLAPLRQPSGSRRSAQADRQIMENEISVKGLGSANF